MNVDSQVSLLPSVSVLSPQKSFTSNDGSFQKLHTSFKMSLTPIHKNLRFKTQQKDRIKREQSSEGYLNKEQKDISKLLRKKKIDVKKNFFFETDDREDSISERKKQKQKTVDESIALLRYLKSKRKLQRYMTEQNKNNPENEGQTDLVKQIIGINIRDSEEQNRQFYLRKGELQKQIHKKKNKQQIGLYSYLQRDFVEKKDHDLTKAKLISYAKNPNDRRYKKIVLEKSRKFLQKITHKKSKQYSKVIDLLEEESKKFIEDEIKVKKQKYTKQYNNRNNIPYLSFLTLNQRQKTSIINRMNRKQSLN